MIMSSKHHRPHVSDENTETVYLTVRSWSGAMSAPYWVSTYYPGYKCVIVTEQVLTEKKSNEQH